MLDMRYLADEVSDPDNGSLQRHYAQTLPLTHEMDVSGAVDLWSGGCAATQ